MTEALPAEGPWIAVRGAGFAYGAVPVLRDVSFDLHPGRHYIVAGPNGAGKSTLLDILCGLKRPGSGTIRVLGRDAAERSPRRFARTLALAPQEFRLDFPFSVREVVAMGRRPHLGRWGRMGCEDARAVERAIDALHLSAIADRPVTALSGGEKRRCVVARALAQAAPILVLDEPCSGLDVAHALAVMALAGSLAERGGLTITVSHDLNLAARHGDEFIFLKNGALAEMGPVGDVFTGPVLSRLYDVEARVGRDEFGGGPVVSFRARA